MLSTGIVLSVHPMFIKHAQEHFFSFSYKMQPITDSGDIDEKSNLLLIAVNPIQVVRTQSNVHSAPNFLTDEIIRTSFH